MTFASFAIGCFGGNFPLLGFTCSDSTALFSAKRSVDLLGDAVGDRPAAKVLEVLGGLNERLAHEPLQEAWKFRSELCQRLVSGRQLLCEFSIPIFPAPILETDHGLD
ncbi:hypothetical protein D9M68_749850 [compost metagenome]